MIKEYWENLAKREQILVIATSVLLIAILFYTLVYSSISNIIVEKQQELSEKTKFVTWLNQQQPKKNPSQNLKPQDLLSTFDAEIKQSLIKNIAYDLQQIPNNELRLSCEAMPFNPFVKWLWSFNEKYQINIKNINIQSTNTPGVVNITVIISSS